MNQLADAGAQFIFPWASGYNTVGPQMAQQLSIPVTASDPGDESANVPGLVQAIETNGQNGGYLAGVLAGKMTQTGTVAIVVSAEDLNWSKMAGGFVAGARSVKPGRQDPVRADRSGRLRRCGGRQARHRERHLRRARTSSSAWATARRSA